MRNHVIRVIDTGGQHRHIAVFILDRNADDRQIFTVSDHIAHERFIIALVHPDFKLFVIAVILCAVDQFELNAEEVFIFEMFLRRIRIDRLLVHEGLDHRIQLLRIPDAECVKHEVGNTAVRIQHEKQFPVVFRPVSGFDVIVVLVQLFFFRQGVEYACGHRRRKCRTGTVSAESHCRKGVVRIYLTVAILVETVDMRRYGIGIFHCTCIVVDVAFGFEICFQ